jgi:uncharacterized membrane protein|tara:strand:- start:3452 stop:3676 length:225 start_codon:yes stop_codon:yes gene_type:complete
MRILSKIRIILAFALLILGMITLHAKDNDKKLEYQKKAIYFEIRAELVAGDITLEEAQKKWRKEIKKLEKKEAK